MILDRTVLEQQRDQALRDIIDLDRQVDEDELSVAAAHRLRTDYQSTAAQAIKALESLSGNRAPEEATTDRRARWSRGRLAIYALAALAALVAALLLPQYAGNRPAGGFVTGNDIGQPGFDSEAAPGAGQRDLATVSDSELESVIADNPDVIEMRLALADRYLEQGDYAEAAGHYAVALAQQPDNPEVQAHYGWFLLQLDQPQEAMRYVDQALSQDPQYLEALWFKANIALYGLSDPATALAVLAQMQQLDLTPTVGNQVAALVETARQQQAGQP